MKPLPLQICFIGESFLPRSLRRSLVCQGVPAQKPWGVGNKKRETFASDMDIFHDTGTWHLQGSKVKTLIFSQPFVSLNCRCFGGYWFITPHYVSVVVFFQCCSEGLIFFGVFDSLAWLRQMDICDAFWGCWYLKFQQLPAGMYCSNPWNNGNNYLSTRWLDFNSISFCLPFWSWKHNWRVRDWNVTLLQWNVFVLLNLESAPHFLAKVSHWKYPDPIIRGLK